MSKIEYFKPRVVPKRKPRKVKRKRIQYRKVVVEKIVYRERRAKKHCGCGAELYNVKCQDCTRIKAYRKGELK